MPRPARVGNCGYVLGSFGRSFCETLGGEPGVLLTSPSFSPRVIHDRFAARGQPGFCRVAELGDKLSLGDRHRRRAALLRISAANATALFALDRPWGRLASTGSG